MAVKIWDIVPEGKWVDIWTMVHLLLPAGMAYGCRKLGMNSATSFLVTMGICSAYEMAEPYFWPHFNESPENQMVDIIVDSIGCVVGASQTPRKEWI